MKKTRILIVDDAVVVRRLVAKALRADEELEVAASAENGQVALRMLPEVKPDVVILDVEMPVMDGLETLQVIRKEYPRLPVIMFSRLTHEGAETTVKALTLGANDYVSKPTTAGSMGTSLDEMASSLTAKIKANCRHYARISAPPSPVGGGKRDLARITTPVPVPQAGGRTKVVAIGVSTGGPNALATMLKGLPTPFSVPILIVQHMPPLFTDHLAGRLDGLTDIRVRVGQDGATVRAGDLWIAPGGRHMEVERHGQGARIRIHDGPPENSCRPAVDVLFRSVARTYGKYALGVILTGMGEDGRRGAEVLRTAGAQILAQDEATSTVWGMPGAVVKAGLADRIVALDSIAGTLAAITSSGAAKRSPERAILGP